MLAVIRISGIPEMPLKAGETLDRMRLRRKYACVLMHETEENLGMVKRVESFVAYGKIDKGTLLELIKARGKVFGNIKGKVDAEKAVSELLEGKTPKKLSDIGLKPFFRLHPPRGGIDSKTNYPRGILGNNQEKINELIRRML